MDIVYYDIIGLILCGATILTSLAGALAVKVPGSRPILLFFTLATFIAICPAIVWSSLDLNSALVGGYNAIGLVFLLLVANFTLLVSIGITIAAVMVYRSRSKSLQTVAKDAERSLPNAAGR